MTRSFTYDAENRQVSATINTSTSSYAYDGLGLRVSVGQETLQLRIWNTVGTSVAGLGAKTAAGVATAVGYAKFAWDLGTFGWGTFHCGN